MYAKSTRPSAKREVQKDRSAKRDDQIARSSLRAKRAARDENVPAKRADFFFYYGVKKRIYVQTGGKGRIACLRVERHAVSCALA